MDYSPETYFAQRDAAALAATVDAVGTIEAPQDLLKSLIRAGLRADDPDLCVVFEGFDPAAPDFRECVRAAHPALFHRDVAALNDSKYSAALGEVNRPASLTMATPTEGFNALTATHDDYTAEMKRMGVRTW